MIVGIEVSRLARSCKDWYQLLEICALFDTLIADMDGVYDASLFNDRLLLGLKGTIFEAELHVLKARMQQGRMAKARRGELSIPLPRGFVRQASGEVILDPDERVRTAIQLVLERAVPRQAGREARLARPHRVALAGDREGRSAGSADVSRDQRQVVDRVDRLGALRAVIDAHRPADERGSRAGVEQRRLKNRID